MARYQPQDRFYKKAQRRGLPSRAAFKIEELIARFAICGPGARVVDLGCAPGGWLHIFDQAVGPRGRIVGVDVVPCERAPAGAVVLVADIGKPSLAAEIARALGGPADLIASDLSPKLSGVSQRDRARARELLGQALGLARKLLKPGGSMVAKIFMGEDFKETVAAFKQHFKQVTITRTGATRPGSAELYLVARGFTERPRAGRTEAKENV